MTAVTRRSVANTIKKLQHTLDMRDWQFVLDGGAPRDTNRLAEVSVVTGSRVARIAVSGDLLRMGRDAMTYVLVHELMHAYLWDLSDHHAAMVGLVKNKQARLIATEAWERVEEHTVDALALVITSLIIPGAGTRLRAVAPIATLYLTE